MKVFAAVLLLVLGACKAVTREEPPATASSVITITKKIKSTKEAYQAVKHMIEGIRKSANNDIIDNYKHAVHVKDASVDHLIPEFSTTDFHTTSYLLSYNPKVGIEYFKTAMAKEKNMSRLLQIKKEFNTWRAKSLEDVDATLKELTAKKETLLYTRIRPHTRAIEDLKNAKAILTNID